MLTGVSWQYSLQCCAVKAFHAFHGVFSPRAAGTKCIARMGSGTLSFTGPYTIKIEISKLVNQCNGYINDIQCMYLTF